MQQSAPLHIPSVLHNTDLGKNILHELKNAKFSSNVFCHNYLCYKSFVLKNNKLIGVKNWEYAGFYPPEFEDIIQKHLEFFA
jgi:thiamine kinase-like enzyme